MHSARVRPRRKTNRWALRPSESLVDLIAGLEVSGSVLDAPCGYGRNARFLAESGYTVVCADLDEKALRSLQDDRYRVWIPLRGRRSLSPDRGRVFGVCADLLAH